MKKRYIILLLLLLAVIAITLYNGLAADILKDYFNIQKGPCQEGFVYGKSLRGCCAEDVTIFKGCSSGWLNP